MRTAIALLGVVVFFLFALVELQTALDGRQPIDQSIEEQLRRARAVPLPHQNTLQDGYVEVPGQAGRFSQATLQEATENRTGRDHTYAWSWGSRDDTATTASALGLDDLHHFVNSYLIGYQPFETDQLWVPLYVLASRKVYEFDHLQYTGLKDVWQNSAQAFRQTRGDCEDHAIALADWLIDMGVDARVALGDYKNEGHAWVMVNRDGLTYLLEATGKQRLSRWSEYRLAATETDYRPKYMFNREHFWVNTGSVFTVRYEGASWRRASAFHPL
ncbi:MAG: transglutaminase domain-containing protein [Pseudomonadota bacterium]